MFRSYTRAVSVGNFKVPVAVAGGGGAVTYNLYVQGQNNYGEFGNGTANYHFTPQTTYSGSTAPAYIASTNYSMALMLTTSGELYYIGAPNTAYFNKSSSLNTWTRWDNNTYNKIAVGRDYFFIAIKSDGTLWSCGYNLSGQLGDGTTTTRTSLVQIGSDTNWSDISCGYGHTIALKSTGTLWGWGLNQYGQVGNSSTTNRTSPIQIGTDTNWSKVSVGAYTSHAIKTTGTLWGWGRNDSGQIGDASKTQRTAPVQVGSATNWSVVKCQYNATNGIQTDGTLWGWGDNQNAQTGLTGASQRTSPTKVGTETNWSKLFESDGSLNTALYAIKTDNTVWLAGTDDRNLAKYNFGDNYGGGMTAADSGLTASFVFVADLKANFIIGSQIKSIGYSSKYPRVFGGYVGGDQYTTPGLTAGGTGKTWKSVSASRNTIYASTATARTVAAYGIDGSDNLYAWGENRDAYNQDAQTIYLGTPTATENFSPVQIGSSTWTKISAGWHHVLGIQSDGTLWAWGMQKYGALGNGTNPATGIREPVKIGTDTWTDIAAGYYCSLGVKSNGTLWAWGYNTGYLLGDGTQTNRLSPVQIGSATNWSKVAMGEFHGLATRTDGTLWGWGTNTYGQIGDNSTTTRTAPVQIGSDTTWSKISAGSNHSLAVKTNGTLWAWGLNYSYNLGDGTTTQRNSPVQIGSDTNWSDVAAGLGFASFDKWTYEYSYVASSHALKSNGTLWAWGDSTYTGLDWNLYTSPTQIGTSTSWKSAPSSTNKFITVLSTT